MIPPGDCEPLPPPAAVKEPARIAGWRVDPSGDHPFRFHNGRRWTEVVLTWDGRIRRSPLPHDDGPRRRCPSGR